LQEGRRSVRNNRRLPLTFPPLRPMPASADSFFAMQAVRLPLNSSFSKESFMRP
jgi:hypothetical protein